ncbi:MAG: insulinase family protein, partial [Pseudomonadota bacterium]
SLNTSSELFGSGSTSRLYVSLVIEQSLAAGAGSAYRGTALDQSVFRLYASPRPDVDLNDLETALDKEIDRLLEDGITDDELERVKRRMVAEAVYARDSLSGAARAFGVALTTGLTVDDVESWPRRIAAITADEVMAAARLVLDNKNAVTGRLIPGNA